MLPNRSFHVSLPVPPNDFDDSDFPPRRQSALDEAEARAPEVVPVRAALARLLPPCDPRIDQLVDLLAFLNDSYDNDVADYFPGWDDPDRWPSYRYSLAEDA